MKQSNRIRFALENHTHNFGRAREGRAAPDVLSEEWNEIVMVNDYGTYTWAPEVYREGAGYSTTSSLIDDRNICEDYYWMRAPENIPDVSVPEASQVAWQYLYESVNSSRFQIQTTFIGAWDRPVIGPSWGFLGVHDTPGKWFEDIQDRKHQEVGVFVDKDTIYACKRHVNGATSNNSLVWPNEEMWIEDPGVPIDEELIPLASFEGGHTYRFLLDVDMEVATVSLTSTNGDDASATLSPMSDYCYNMAPFFHWEEFSGTEGGKLGFSAEGIEIRTPFAGFIRERPPA